jgi:hypothetical protein
MLTNNALRLADGGTEAATRRRLLRMGAAVTATGPLAVPTAGGTAQVSPETASGDAAVSPNRS